MPLHRLQRGPFAASMLSLALLMNASAATAEGHAHVHGSAELRIVVDGPQLEIGLESPLDNLLGFERSPRNDKERAQVRAMADSLRQASALFTPTLAARCAVVGVEIAAPTLPAELLRNPKTSVAGVAAEGGDHADLDATYRWRCEAPAQLKGLDVGLMQAFPGLRTVKVQVVGPRGQSAAVLSSGMRSIVW